ncbi:MAG: 16S rRNA (cytosine(967)-C(5))-methyltransferase RsmB, partial [Desulfobacterales bacterium]
MPKARPHAQPPSSRPTRDPRRGAAEILLKVDSQNVPLDRALEKYLARHRDFDLRDQRLMHALVFGVLRYQGQLDYFIGSFSRTPLEKMHPPVRVILRLAIFQMRFMDRIPDPAAVHTAVELAKQLAPPWSVKFVNAVLRRAVREQHQVDFPDEAADPIQALAVQYAYPPWMVRRWLERWGRGPTEAHLKAHNAIAPIGIRTNTLKTNTGRLADALAELCGSLSPGWFAADHLNITAPTAALPELKPFTQGGFQVQDEAAHLVALLCDPQPGERILDACAGLGGKTGALAQLMTDSGSILATDRAPWKLERLKIEMQRLGVTQVTTRKLDLTAAEAFKGESPFDRILLDAPCSGLGVIRRNPDTKWRKQPQDILRHGEHQFRLLQCLAPHVKPGGVLTYAVCSTETEENEDVIRRFLTAHQDFKVAHDHPRLSAAALQLVDGEGFLRTQTAQHGLDGFFAVKLQRRQHYD